MSLIVIKLGTRVVTERNGAISLSNLTPIVEQISQLVQNSHQVILITSGAIAHGKSLISGSGDSKVDQSVWASLGQTHLMSVYQQLFQKFDLKVGQMLLTGPDLADNRVQSILTPLLKSKIIPILNENDVTTALEPLPNYLLTDNDGLASIIAQQMKAQHLLILTDVDGVYFQLTDSQPIRKFLSHYLDQIEFNQHHHGRGGMQSKVEACLETIQSGKVQQVVIGNGCNLLSEGLIEMMKGERGTRFKFFKMDTVKELSPQQNLSEQSFDQRKSLVQTILGNLESEALWTSNLQDLKAAIDISPQTRKRLELTPGKLDQTIQGIQTYMKTLTDPLNQVLLERNIYSGILLQKVTAPLGTIFIIFEARPEVIPQVVSLAILSGNHIILKGGKEAQKTNFILFESIQKSLVQCGVSSETVQMISTRAQAQKLLTSDDIQLVIPRGSSQLVKWVQKYSQIPVLAHAEGICHLYLDQYAELDRALKIVLDAKLQYPAVCNSIETLLIDRNWKTQSQVKRFLETLQGKGCQLLAGPHMNQTFPEFPLVQDFHVEYGDHRLTVEWVNGLDEAISHINTYSSHHTDGIITEHRERAEQFLQRVDSSSVFSNVSTRFADGRRYGLGAELGISTCKVHARGPVGLEGLLSTKYLLRSSTPQTVSQYES